MLDALNAEGLAENTLVICTRMEETDDPLLQGPVPAPVGAEINTRDQLSPNDPPVIVT